MPLCDPVRIECSVSLTTRDLKAALSAAELSNEAVIVSSPPQIRSSSVAVCLADMWELESPPLSCEYVWRDSISSM